MAYGDFKDLTRTTASVKILHNKALNITKNPNYDGYQRGLYSMFCKIFDKKTAGGAAKNAIMQKKESAEELNKSIIRKFQKKSKLIFYRLYLGC